MFVIALAQLLDHCGSLSCREVDLSNDHTLTRSDAVPLIAWHCMHLVCSLAVITPPVLSTGHA